MRDTEAIVRTHSQMLQDGLDAVTSELEYQHFLNFISNNPNYTYRNALIILQQCPRATKTRGFKGWLKFNRVVKKDETGLRINAMFGKDDKDEKKKPTQAKKMNFKKISIFDISQTSVLDENAEAPSDPMAPSYHIAALPDRTQAPKGEVKGFEEILSLIQLFSPLSIRFRSGLNENSSSAYGDISILNDLSQAHALYAIVNQIVRCWRRTATCDKERQTMEAEGVAYIVCQYFGIDTSDISFYRIARYRMEEQREELKDFLESIQVTALYFIDSFEGAREAQRLDYETLEYYLFINPKRAHRLFSQKYAVYLVIPDKGELPVMNRDQIAKHKGCFAVDRFTWLQALQMAA